MVGYVLLGLLSFIVLFLLVIIIRALMFKPKNTVVSFDAEVEFDKETAVSNLQTLVKFKTISHYDESLQDKKEFDGFINALQKLFPTVFKNCEFKNFNDSSILLKWKGKNSNAPAVLMSHYDVVPVSEEGWDVPAFSGIIKNGALYGRGTLDTKVTLNAALTSAETLLKQGFVPENDVYFAFSACEEVNGDGAVKIVDYFEQNNIEPAIVLDEGGAVVENVFPGVKVPCGLIGIAEKGMIDAKYVAKSQGGHASAPKPHTPVGLLANACCKVENHPFKTVITKPVKEMFDTLGRHSSFLYKLIFANLWCFKWVIDLLCNKQGGELNALMRTTVAFTQMEGSSVSNVIPPQAFMVSNMRLNPSNNVESALNYLRKTVKNDKIEISAIRSVNPSRISRTDVDGYNRVKNAISSTWKGVIVSPYLMVQCSDSRHYGRISDRVYRFSAMDLTSEERATIHGHNEHIRLETIYKSVEFYMKLLKQC